MYSLHVNTSARIITTVVPVLIQGHAHIANQLCIFVVFIHNSGFIGYKVSNSQGTHNLLDHHLNHLSIESLLIWLLIQGYML